MARLNEPPVTGESLESLKRRFIRQNREITRANSAQSIRIRNLECETSRLLSENVTLREQNIQLQRQLESHGNRLSTADKVGQIKSQLEIKLAELGGLVYELGTIHKKTRRSNASQENSRPDGRTPKKSPDQRNWKNAFTLSEVTGQSDGRLPPILEDKLYPRRTLESAEIASILTDVANLTDSPDLGPPPIAHFEDTDPIRYDVREKGEEEESSLGFSSIMTLNNLETRKKRRESSYTGSSLPHSVEVALSASTALAKPVPAQSLKSGAKRKFSARDTDDPKDSIFNPQMDEFQFNRRGETVATLPETEEQSGSSTIQTASPGAASRSQPTSRPTKPSRDNDTPTTSSRKALAEKSVNNSPVKPKTSTVDASSEAHKDVLKKPKDRQHERSRPKPPTSMPQRPLKLDSTERSTPPIIESTPPTLDAELNPDPKPEPGALIIPPSPSTFAPSTTSTPHPSPNTPPPAGLGATRPSRRQRGSVSYAEPNLRDKMRRPTKDLVDAVAGDEKAYFHRSASARAESEGLGEGDVVIVTGEKRVEKPRATRTVIVKAEKTEEENWKDLPLAKTTKHGEINVGRELSESLETGTGGKDDLTTSIEGGKEETKVAKKASGSSAAIAALAGPSRAKSTRTRETAVDSRDTSTAQQQPSEVISAESSNPSTESTSKHSRPNPASAISVSSRSVLLAANRTSRRYSSVPEAMGKDIAQRTTASSAQDAGSRTGTARKRESAHAPRKNAVESVEEVEIRGGAVAGLGHKKGDKGDRETERAERVAVRRRSMMI